MSEESEESKELLSLKWLIFLLNCMCLMRLSSQASLGLTLGLAKIFVNLSMISIWAQSHSDNNPDVEGDCSKALGL